MKKKKKTNKEHINEDLKGYKLAREVIDNQQKHSEIDELWEDSSVKV